MGASNNTGSFGNIFTVVHGKWTKRVPEGTEGASSRPLTKGKNEGQIVHEMGFNRLSGHLTAGMLEKADFGWSAKVTLHDRQDGEDYVMSLPIDSKFIFDIIKRLPVINPDEELILSLSESKKKRTKSGGPVYNLYITQEDGNLDDQYVKWSTDETGKHTPTYLNGAPPPELDPITESYDYKAHERFLLSKFKAFFNEFKPSSVPHQLEDEKPPVSDKDVPADFDEYDSDIPF